MNKNAVWWIVGVIVVIALGVWYMNMRNQGQQNPTQATTDTTPVASTSNQATQQVSNTKVSVLDRSSSTVAGVIAGLSGASEFKGLLAASGVNLNGKGPYTVFVPTDAGFKYITPGTITSMSAVQKKRLVQYHIVSGRALNVIAADSGTIQALSADSLNFNVQKSGNAQVNSSFVLNAYKAKNGVVYIINQPLIPPVKAN